MAKVIQFSSWYNLTKRLLVSPLFLLIMLIVSLLATARSWIHFVRFGGEHIVYDRADPATLDKIYQELKKGKEDNHDH